MNILGTIERASRNGLENELLDVCWFRHWKNKMENIQTFKGAKSVAAPLAAGEQGRAVCKQMCTVEN